MSDCYNVFMIFLPGLTNYILMPYYLTEFLTTTIIDNGRRMTDENDKGHTEIIDYSNNGASGGIYCLLGDGNINTVLSLCYVLFREKTARENSARNNLVSRYRTAEALYLNTKIMTYSYEPDSSEKGLLFISRNIFYTSNPNRKDRGHCGRFFYPLIVCQQRLAWPAAQQHFQPELKRLCK